MGSWRTGASRQLADPYQFNLGFPADQMLFVITTDGTESSSREYTCHQAGQLIAYLTVNTCLSPRLDMDALISYVERHRQVFDEAPGSSVDSARGRNGVVPGSAGEQAVVDLA